jgi:hypothetical protein
MKKEDITDLFDVTGKVAIITGGDGGFYRHVDPAFIQGL